MGIRGSKHDEIVTVRQIYVKSLSKNMFFQLWGCSTGIKIQTKKLPEYGEKEQDLEETEKESEKTEQKSEKTEKDAEEINEDSEKAKIKRNREERKRKILEKENLKRNMKKEIISKIKYEKE